MPRGTLVRLLIFVLAGAAGGGAVFSGHSALAVPQRLRLPPSLPLKAFGDTFATEPQTATPVTEPEPYIPPGRYPKELVPWRRTRQGWEKATWLEKTSSRQPALHPLIVTALEILLALMGCLATAGRSGRQDAPRLGLR